jgi:tight adherence protein B
LVPLRTLVVAIVGSATAAVLASFACRFAVADRLRYLPGERVLPVVVRRPLARALDDAALTWTPEQAIEVWLLAIGIAALVGAGVAPATGVLGAIAVIVGGPVALRVGRYRRERVVTAAVPDTLEQIGSELRAGGTVATALTSIAHGDGVLAADASRIEARVRLGAGLSDALRSWAQERRAVGVEVAAGALALSATVGGPAADALDGLASSLRARLSVIAEARALSAQARYSAWVIGLAPIGYLVSTAAVDSRSVHVLVGTAAGRTCVVLGVGLELLGAIWMRAIVRSGNAA